MTTVRVDKQGWIRCGQCGHKLGKVVGAWSDVQAMPGIEVKCHSCKVLNMIGGEGNHDRQGNKA